MDIAEVRLQPLLSAGAGKDAVESLRLGAPTRFSWRRWAEARRKRLRRVARKAAGARSATATLTAAE